MNYRRALVSDSGEILLLHWSERRAGWVPEIEAMTLQRMGQLRVYNSRERLIVTVNQRNETLEWPILCTEEYHQLRAITEHPWISPDAVWTIDDDETVINRFDQWLRGQRPPGGEMPLRMWEAISRPLLLLSEAAIAVQLLPSAPEYEEPEKNSSPPPLPKHVANLVLQKAEQEGTTCPITMEPIKAMTAAVTSCGHVFQMEALKNWLQTNRHCPECRQPCST